MRLGKNIEFGWWTLKQGLEFSVVKAPCGCIIISLGLVFVTFLKGDCRK